MALNNFETLILDDHLLDSVDVNRLSKWTMLYFGKKLASSINRSIASFDVILTHKAFLSPEEFQFPFKTRMICLALSGYDLFDISSFQKLNITVCYCPDYATEAVAEHTIGLILSVVRKIAKADNMLKSSRWEKKGTLKLRGIELKNRVLGIIGAGRIGNRVADIARIGFEMKVVQVDSRSSKTELHQLLKKSDIISIHANLNNKTQHLLGEDEFQLLKPGVVIINTARGAIIDEKYLFKYLKKRVIRGIGLDVFEQEPLLSDHVLRQLPNVVLTPHIAFNTQEAYIRLSQQVADTVIAYIKGNPINKVPGKKYR